MLCRRCNSPRLLRLAVIRRGDNPVYRCLECGFLFSPSSPEERANGANS